MPFGLCRAELRAVEPVVLERVAGLRARLEIVRDRDGVPHIRAGTEADAIFGLGFVHAQDRLWQLDHIRRLGRGRLAEVLGPSGLKADKLFRTLGVAQSAAATWAGYSPAHRELITSYVAGLNAGHGSTAAKRSAARVCHFELPAATGGPRGCSCRGEGPRMGGGQKLG